MIVSVNQNIDKLNVSDKYSLLFARAYQTLEKYDKKNGTKYLKDEAKHEDHTFHSIDEYFAHLAELASLDGTFMMLPLDEVPFAINANTRTITAPKMVVMQNDQNSEIVIFTIDRYFDYKDLDTANIYVQWTLPDGTEGATKVELKDLSIPGKIRFGWPLDSEITSQKGIVKFSVRFWNIGKIKDENGVERDTVVYSFNTLTSNLHISESLQPHLNEDYSVNSPKADGYFKKAIINSQLHTANMAIPLEPYFEEPGLELNEYESLSTVIVDGEPKETLTLMAQAINPDTGELSYEWQYAPAEDKMDGENILFAQGTWYSFEDKVDEEGNIIPGFNRYGGTVNYNHYEPVTLDDKDELVAGEKYYMLSGGDYVAYDGSTPRPQLYEKFTTYTVPDNEADGTIVPVTGRYKVTAVNTIKSTAAESTSQNTSAPVDSKTCYLVSPDNITFKANGDLEPTEIFPVDADGNPLSMDLTVNVKEDDSIAAKRSYTWFYRRSPLGEGEALVDDKGVLVKPDNADEPIVKDAADEGHKLNITEPGWYQVTVQSTLNRETKSQPSTCCKVTYKAVAPQVAPEEEGAVMPILAMAYGDIAVTKPQDNGVPRYYVNQNETATLDVKTILTVPSGYDSSLYSEGLTYTWGYQLKDQPFKYLTEKDVGDDKLIVDGLGTPALTIRQLEDGVAYTYKCVITNTVNGQSASCSLGDALSFIVD